MTGVIVTRQGKGSFVADSADLSTQLRRDELDEHLPAAADIGRRLGMTAEAMTPGASQAARSEAANDRREDDENEP